MFNIITGWNDLGAKKEKELEGYKGHIIFECWRTPTSDKYYLARKIAFQYKQFRILWGSYDCRESPQVLKTLIDCREAKQAEFDAY
jgi:hypothetical protein